MKFEESGSMIGSIIIIIVVIIGGLYFWGSSKSERSFNEIQKDKECGEYTVGEFNRGIVPLKCVKELDLQL